jgi:hypothetical protein
MDETEREERAAQEQLRNEMVEPAQELVNIMSLPIAAVDRILSFWWEHANQSQELQVVCTKLKMTNFLKTTSFTRTQLCTMCVEVGRKVRLRVGPVERACKELRVWCHEVLMKPVVMTTLMHHKFRPPTLRPTKIRC